jgi:RimJ/RimL family protein N-acetyltransferase
MLPLHTPRLVLRPFQAADAEPFAAYRADPEVARYQSWDASYTIFDAIVFMADLARAVPGKPGEWYQVAIEERATGVLVGDCAFCVLAEDDRQAEIGFTVARPYQGQGLAGEAVGRLLEALFMEFNLHRIRAICDVENHASAKLLERLGFRREGHFVEHVWFKGQWASEYFFALLRHEWAERATNGRLKG